MIHKESESESKMVPVFKQIKRLYNILAFAVCDTTKHSETFSQTKHLYSVVFVNAIRRYNVMTHM